MRDGFPAIRCMELVLRSPFIIFLTIFAIRQSVIEIIRPTNPHKRHSPKRIIVMPGGENPRQRAHPFRRLEMNGQLRWLFVKITIASPVSGTA